MVEPLDVEASLRGLSDSVATRFRDGRRVLSFPQYLELVAAEPARYARDASQYLCDVFEHFGSVEVQRPWGTETRYRLFDAQVGSTDIDEQRELVGQEQVQQTVLTALKSFAREGRANRLLLLHGPNGSAKSTFAACVMRAAEAYSQTDEGALYRFSWIFPRGNDAKGIGFGGASAGAAGDSFAHLSEARIDAKLASELREHPLLLLPRAERIEWLAKLFPDGGAPEWLKHAELGHKNKQVFEALLTAYRGDFAKVLMHVQVERWYISRRYRVGAVTIGPQLSVDARERQITADRSLSSLPASLSALTLFESYGELVDAAGGILEFSDLLKRPLDAWKYLLLAIENGEIALSFSNMPINSVMLASSNEGHLDAFRSHPEFASFRGRIQFAAVPYLRDAILEQRIYDTQVATRLVGRFAPHVTYLAALWAVLTRLRKSDAGNYASSQLGKIAAGLSPLEKADLFAHGRIPRRLGADEKKILEQGISTVFDEPAGERPYEGLLGISPREVRTLLVDLASESGGTLTPIELMKAIEQLCARVDDFDFLRTPVDCGYHDAKGFVLVLRERWLDLVDESLRVASGLVDDAQYVTLFDRYVTHVSHSLEKRQVLNIVTGKYDEPDAELMKRVEAQLDVKDGTVFRKELMGRIAAWAIDHPEETKLDYRVAFPTWIETLEDAYYAERTRGFGGVLERMLASLSGTDDSEGTDKQAWRLAEETKSRLLAMGYSNATLAVALSELYEARYRSARAAE